MRYSRQTPFLGEKEQELLSKKTITIIGLGALGSNAANLLARAGVNLKLIDKDKVELSNLQRQGIYTEEDVDKEKTKVAKEFLNKVNSEIKIEVFNEKLTKKNIDLIRSNVILDCLDNMETRLIINDYCLKNKIPWIHAAAIKDQGVIFNIIPGKACLNCLYNQKEGIERCEDVGILNSIANIIASLQVNESIKILLNKNPEEKLVRFNITSNEITKIKVSKNPNCPSCGKDNFLINFELKLCKTRDALSLKPRKNMQLNLNEIKKHYETLVNTPILIVIKKDNHEIIIKKDGEMIFKDLEDENKILEIGKEIISR